MIESSVTMPRSFPYPIRAGRHLELPTCPTVESLIRSLAWVRRRQEDEFLFVACGGGGGISGRAWFFFGIEVFGSTPNSSDFDYPPVLGLDPPRRGWNAPPARGDSLNRARRGRANPTSVHGMTTTA